jgi:predicted  nucleic acid-binding Zn-ribbon protein
MDNIQGEKKSFWKRPEGKTGAIFLAALILGGGYLLTQLLPVLLGAMSNILVLAGTLLVIGLILYMILDPKMRTLIGYMYKSVMRWITSIFVTIDPIGILKNYVDDLQDNLSKMSKQIGNIRGQMRKLKTQIETNEKEIENNMLIASKAKEKGMEKEMVLSSRKAARLKETNAKYATLLKKLEILHRVLNKMYKNSEILLEDTKDQVKLKEQERKAIRASHSAMKSAMSVISGDKDKRAMFDQAIEVIADDVANKVGEMERFMEMSSDFMNKVDLENGIFEERGMQMLEKWEKESTMMLLSGNDSDDEFDLEGERPERSSSSSEEQRYDKLFD